MKNFYKEVVMPAQVDATEFSGFINRPGFLGLWENNGVMHLYWDVDQWSDEVEAAIQEGIITLGGRDQNQSVTVRQIPGLDWNAEWAASVKPISIGQRIVIRPSWETANCSKHSIEIVLDPKQAFGTGHHATTQLLLEWIEELIQGGEHVLDVGTGSGILAMVALRLGAGSALGLDHDSVAMDCAKEYAAMNGFDDELSLHVGTLDALDPIEADLILANLDCETLLSMIGQFKHFLKNSGKMLLSGILVDDYREIAGAYASEGWIECEVREREGWLAIGFER